MDLESASILEHSHELALLLELDEAGRSRVQAAYVGTNFVHHHFIKIAKYVEFSALDSSFSAVSKRNLARKDSCFPHFVEFAGMFRNSCLGQPFFACFGGVSICTLLFDVNGLGTRCSLFSRFESS